MGALDALSPSLASRVAERIFTTPHRRVPRDWERSVLAEAVPFRIRAGGTEVRGARVGGGPAVLLVHGWGGGGAQLAAFVPPLLDAGCTAVVFDGPAHGASDGATATIPELADAVREVARRTGARAAIGHSAGGAAVALALHRGLVLDAAVLIGPPRSGAGILDAFCAEMRLGADTRERLRRRIERRAGVLVGDLEFAVLAAGLSTPALVIHDREDREVAFDDGAAIAEAWPAARLLTTGGLGHRRILRDPAVIEEARAFVVGQLVRCGCGRLATETVDGDARCETCLLERHLARREERRAGMADALTGPGAGP
jgi:pimeloyl-ACP methyl ester carboxylesterase